MYLSTTQIINPQWLFVNACEKKNIIKKSFFAVFDGYIKNILHIFLETTIIDAKFMIMYSGGRNKCGSVIYKNCKFYISYTKKAMTSISKLEYRY